MRLATSEAMLFKFGSGTGTDLSTLRSSREKLSGGGKPSGPVSFMRVYDAIASVVKSGGKTRRAAKMQTLKCWHPDILEFIECKTNEEQKAQALIRAGYEANFNGAAYSSVMFQNANLSVRCSDAFLRAGEADADWTTRAVTTGRTMDTYKAKVLLDKIAEGTWLCGDPGMQYEDTIQRWHTCPNTAPINSSNPCSEYMFIDDSACNLASINLMKFVREDGGFDVERFRAAVRVFITAQEILVDHASYPTDRIAANSHKFRPLGLGFANLGSLLMSAGLPYDSDQGRGLAGGDHGDHARPGVPDQLRARGARGGVRRLRGESRADAAGDGDAPRRGRVDRPLGAGRPARRGPLDLGRVPGVGPRARLSQQPGDGAGPHRHDRLHDGLRHHGHRAGHRAGEVQAARRRRDAQDRQPDGARGPAQARLRRAGDPGILDFIDARDTIEGAPGLKDEHLPVFDCAFAPPQGGRSIHFRGHLGMMAAVQPFLSGAISKTVNMPTEATVEDIREAYLEGWRLGLKALAIYRDGSKGSQPVSTKSESSKESAATPVIAPSPDASVATRDQAPPAIVEARPMAVVPTPSPAVQPRRERLPHTRRSLTHKFDIQGHEGYINVGFYPDGRPGELFITMAKEGSTIGGLMDVLGTSISIGLQYGVPLEVFVNKFAHSRFEPAGFTKNPDIPIAKSIADYIFRWLGMEFIPGYREANAPKRATPEPEPTPVMPVLKVNGHRTATIADLEHAEAVMGTTHQPEVSEPHLPSGELSVDEGLGEQDRQFAHFQSDAPPCDNCGALTVRCGTCYRCFNCGNSMGCS